LSKPLITIECWAIVDYCKRIGQWIGAEFYKRTNTEGVNDDGPKGVPIVANQLLDEKGEF